eukprot:TRINITY_DN50730_c0_g1_i1.p1 TRINITY_DN50730_c0_g1~~TRINITY_DN50730_c0_g1_i1.p1  ORF type:complete len:460 (+),score=106.97 TRINITY_DN50730_c0_g1_i1:89-1468(+)
MAAEPGEGAALLAPGTTGYSAVSIVGTAPPPQAGFRGLRWVRRRELRRAASSGIVMALFVAAASVVLDTLPENAEAAERASLRATNDSGVVLPPLVREQLVEGAPKMASLSDFMLNPYAVCHAWTFTMTPVYITMCRSALVAMLACFFAMMPRPMGGGKVTSPGVLPILWAGINALLGAYGLFRALFWDPLPEQLPELGWFNRYALRMWSACLSGHFTAVITIGVHQLILVVMYEDKHGSDGDDGQGCCEEVFDCDMKGSLMNGIAFFAMMVFMVILFLLSPFIVPQMVMVPIGALCNILNGHFYKMCFLIVGSMIVPFSMFAIPGYFAVKFSLSRTQSDGSHLEDDEIDDETSNFLTLKLFALFSCCLVLLLCDWTAYSILLYNGEGGPCKTITAVYDARQTCAWVDCMDAKYSQPVNLFLRTSQSIEFGPLLHSVFKRISPVDCPNAQDYGYGSSSG